METKIEILKNDLTAEIKGSEWELNNIYAPSLHLRLFNGKKPEPGLDWAIYEVNEKFYLSTAYHNKVEKKVKFYGTDGITRYISEYLYFGKHQIRIFSGDIRHTRPPMPWPKMIEYLEEKLPGQKWKRLGAGFGIYQRSVDPSGEWPEHKVTVEHWWGWFSVVHDSGGKYFQTSEEVADFCRNVQN